MAKFLFKSIPKFRPPHALALGYLSYIVIGWFLLSLPISQEKAALALDHLFIATSAVSTTGLATVDPGATYSWFGEFIILILFQLGGLGYMTTSSYILIAAQKKLSLTRVSILRGAFSLPASIGLAHLVRNMVVFTLICEFIGALLLLPVLINAGVSNPIWSAIFHSVSAFCTAGFSLFSNSFESLKGSTSANLIIAVLSYLGGIGFIVVTDIWENIKGRSESITFTTKVILYVTILFSIIGTALIYCLEPSFSDLTPYDRLLASFFQTMTASTTVGFNTVPIGKLALPTIMVLYFLMFFGASPAGTGGGLKSTTLTALIAQIWSYLRGSNQVCFFGREIPQNRIITASVSASSYAIVLGLGIFLLSICLPDSSFEWIVFEAISALGTVGLSMGLTSELSSSAKLVVIGLMYIGRLGVATFGLLLISQKITEPKVKDDLVV